MAVRNASTPLIADPMRQAVRGPVSPSIGRRAWARASWQTAIVRMTKAAFQLYASLASTNSRAIGSQSGISPTTSQTDSTRQRVTFRKPASPRTARSHVRGNVLPSGVAAP